MLYNYNFELYDVIQIIINYYTIIIFIHESQFVQIDVDSFPGDIANQNLKNANYIGQVS